MPQRKVSQKTTEDANKKTLSYSITITFPDSPHGQIKKTRKERRHKIREFANHLADFHILLVTTMVRIPIETAITLFSRAGSQKKDIKKQVSKDPSDLLNLMSHNEVITPTMRVCAEEFHVFLFELQTAGYAGAARSLRCILETAVEACAFQTEGNKPSFPMLFEEYYTLVTQKESEKPVQSLMLRYNAWGAFIERYRIYEKIKRIAPSFKELVNDLNSLQIFQEAPQVNDELKIIYERLSDYVHPSSAKFERAIAERKAPIVPLFHPEEFDAIYELGLKTLDVVQFLYLKSMTYFFGLETSKDFLKELAKQLALPQKRRNFLDLPFSKKLSSGIKWKVLKKNR